MSTHTPQQQQKQPRDFKYIVVDTENARDAEGIDKVHRKKGWKKNGWHFVITNGGRVQSAENCTKVRGLHEASATVGACGPGYNGKTLGICLAGELPHVPSRQQDAALQSLIAELSRRFSIPAESVMTRQQMYDGCPKANGKQANAPALKLPTLDEPQPQPTALPVRIGPPEYHTAEHGDSIQSIADEYGTTVQAICEINGFDSETTEIYIGQRIRLTPDN